MTGYSAAGEAAQRQRRRRERIETGERILAELEDDYNQRLMKEVIGEIRSAVSHALAERQITSRQRNLMIVLDGLSRERKNNG